MQRLFQQWLPKWCRPSLLLFPFVPLNSLTNRAPFLRISTFLLSTWNTVVIGVKPIVCYGHDFEENRNHQFLANCPKMWSCASCNCRHVTEHLMHSQVAMTYDCENLRSWSHFFRLNGHQATGCKLRAKKDLMIKRWSLLKQAVIFLVLWTVF